MENDLNPVIVTTLNTSTGEHTQSSVSQVSDTAHDVKSDSSPDNLSASDSAKPESKKVPDGVQKRFGEYSRKVAEKEAKIAELEAKLSATQTAISEQQATAPQEGEPNPGDYLAGEFDPDYLRACRKYDREQVKAELKQELTAETKAQSEQNAFANLENDYASNNSDYLEVRDLLLENEIVNESQALAEAIFAHENPAAVMHWLGKNIDEAERIAHLSPMKAAIEIGKLNIEPTKTRTSAPKPATPMQTGAGNITTDPYEIPLGKLDDYVEARNKKGAGFVRMINY